MGRRPVQNVPAQYMTAARKKIAHGVHLQRMRLGGVVAVSRYVPTISAIPTRIRFT